MNFFFISTVLLRTSSVPWIGLFFLLFCSTSQNDRSSSRLWFYLCYSYFPFYFIFWVTVYINQHFFLTSPPKVTRPHAAWGGSIKSAASFIFFFLPGLRPACLHCEGIGWCHPEILDLELELSRVLGGPQERIFKANTRFPFPTPWPLTQNQVSSLGTFPHHPWQSVCSRYLGFFISNCRGRGPNTSRDEKRSVVKLNTPPC